MVSWIVTWLLSQDKEKKMKSLNAEINNGRLAMMAIIGALICNWQPSNLKTSVAQRESTFWPAFFVLVHLKSSPQQVFLLFLGPLGNGEDNLQEHHWHEASPASYTNLTS